jgi:uncharacterized protein YkwD
MLRVHNELRVAVGAPAARPDARLTAAAQHHAEYLARAGAIGHDESAGAAGFTGATVRDRLAAQGYPDANASEVAASSGSGTEDVRFLWDLPYHRLGLMHPHTALAGWGHAEIGCARPRRASVSPHRGPATRLPTRCPPERDGRSDIR